MKGGDVCERKVQEIVEKDRRISWCCFSIRRNRFTIYIPITLAIQRWMEYLGCFHFRYFYPTFNS